MGSPGNISGFLPGLTSCVLLSENGPLGSDNISFIGQDGTFLCAGVTDRGAGFSGSLDRTQSLVE